MASIVQSYSSGSGNTSTDKTFTLPSATQNGSTLVLAMAVDNGPNKLTAVGDSAGNTWTILPTYEPSNTTTTFAYCIGALSVTTISPTITDGDQVAYTFWELSSDLINFVGLSSGESTTSTTAVKSPVTIGPGANAVLGIASNSSNARPLGLDANDLANGWTDHGNQAIGTSMNGDGASRIFDNESGLVGPQFILTSGSAVVINTQTIAFSASDEVIADFTADVIDGYDPLTVQFNNLSVNAISSSWTFGDGGTSTEDSPLHTYTTPGKYTVSLEVSDGSTTDTKTVVDYITVRDSSSSPKLSTRFDGTELPSFWQFSNPTLSGSVSVADGVATINVPAVQTDTIFSTSSPDNSTGLITQLPGVNEDLDVAFQINTDVSDMRGFGINLLAFGQDDTSAVRFSYYHDDSISWGIKAYAYSRSGGSGSSPYNATYDRYMSGCGNWFRLQYIAATGVWNAYTSSDGWNWSQKMARDSSGSDTTLTQQFIPYSVKIGIHQNAVSPVAKDVSISRIVNILTEGTDDLRDPVPSLTQSNVSTLLGTDGALPTGWVDESAGTDTLTWTGTALRLNHDATQRADFGAARASIRWAGSPVDNWGIYIRVSAPVGNTNCYFTVAGGIDQGGIDQYTWGAGYGLEVQSGTIRRPIRIDDVSDGTASGTAPTASSTDLDETPYTHLSQNSAASNINSDGNVHCIRLERIGPRYRVKEWLDGSAEPSTWGYFDGQDEIITAPMSPFFSLSHNGVRSGTCTFDIHEIQFYEFVESGGGGETAASIWDGSTEIPVSLTLWDGTQEVPVTLEVWEGDTI